MAAGVESMCGASYFVSDAHISPFCGTNVVGLLKGGSFARCAFDSTYGVGYNIDILHILLM